MLNIEELTIGQLRELQALIAPSAACSAPDPKGALLNKNVIVRTVTMIYTGRLTVITPTDLVLVDCSWIPETDRFMQFVADGKVRECEPYPDDLPVFINRGALLDMCELRKELPRSQK